MVVGQWETNELYRMDDSGMVHPPAGRRNAIVDTADHLSLATATPS